MKKDSIRFWINMIADIGIIFLLPWPANIIVLLVVEAIACIIKKVPLGFGIARCCITAILLPRPYVWYALIGVILIPFYIEGFRHRTPSPKPDCYEFIEAANKERFWG